MGSVRVGREEIMYRMYFVFLIFFCLHQASAYLKCSQEVCLGANYSKLELPSKTNNLVGVSFDIDEVLKIEDSSNSITFSIFLNVEWNENRLIFTPEFGKDSNGLVPISANFVKDLWLPNIFIYNLRSFEVMDVLRRLSGLWIDADKNIPYSQAATITFYCPFDFKNFPLDSHNCVFKLGSYSYNDKIMPFTTKTFGMKATKNSGSFSLKSDVDISALSENLIQFGFLGNFSVAGFEMKISRRSQPYIVSYYLPSGLLVCLSWMTFLLPPEDSLARLSVVLVPVLVLPHLLLNTATTVPTSSGMSALEIWLVSCLCFVLAAFLESAFLLRRNKNEQSDRKIELWSIGGYSVLFVAFNIAYWATYL